MGALGHAGWLEVQIHGSLALHVIMMLSAMCPGSMLLKPVPTNIFTRSNVASLIEEQAKSWKIHCSSEG